VEPNDSESGREIAEAVRAVRAGDVQAYATIVKRFQGPLMTLGTALLRDRQAAEELTQDAMVHAFERLDLFDARRPMKPWLCKIAYRLAQQRWRAHGREQTRLEAAAPLIEPNVRDPGPMETLLAAERSEMLWHAVSRLPMAQRTAVVLYYRESLTVNEVAEAMGISPDTVKTHLVRARGRIHAELTERHFDAGDIS
jgi:RNA polymerase sigma-70 factor, ECF subfamily